MRRLLHPFMPFVTEDLWQRLPKPGGALSPSIMTASYPEPQQSWQDAEAEQDMELVLSIVARLRNARTGRLCPQCWLAACAS